MDRRPTTRTRWAGPLMAGIAISVVLSLALRRFAPVFILFLPLLWTRRR